MVLSGGNLDFLKSALDPVANRIREGLQNYGFREQQGYNPFVSVAGAEGTAASQTSNEPGFIGPTYIPGVPNQTQISDERALSSTNAQNTQPKASSGADLKNPNVKPGENYFWDAADGWKQITGPSQEEIDASFNPILDVYNQAESNLKGQLPGLIGEAEAQANVSRQLLQNQRTGANELLGQQETATNTQASRQQAQQRQLLQELQMANQQKFGGASSAGLGASEIQGREYQRSQFGIQENAQQALQSIGQQKQVVEREYNQGLQQLEVNRQQAVNDINRKFQDKMLEINARRGETEAAKAQARLSALQELRNQAFQINIAREQFAQELKLQAQSNSSYLDQVANQFTGAGQTGAGAYNQYASTTPSQISGVQGTSQQTPGTLTGQISGQRPEDLYTGQVSTGRSVLDQSLPIRNLLGR